MTWPSRKEVRHEELLNAVILDPGGLIVSIHPFRPSCVEGSTMTTKTMKS